MQTYDLDLESLSSPQNGHLPSQSERIKREASKNQLRQSLYGQENLDNEFARVCCDFCEQQIQSIDPTVFQPLFNMKGRADTRVRYPDFFSLMVAIAEMMRTTSKPDASLSDIACDLLLESDGLASSSDPIVRLTAMNAVFTVLGWYSMLYEPSLKPNKTDLSISKPMVTTKNASRHLSSLPIAVCARRTVSGLLMSFGKRLPKPNFEAPSHMFHVSSIAFYALKRFGKINVVWVNCLSAHLDFDPLTRTLMLFRLPSFCALFCVSHGSRSPMELFNFEDHDAVESMAMYEALMREILLSYRVIFGQDSRSRKMFKSTERKRAREGDVYDRLLDVLCGEQFGKTVRSLPHSIWPEACIGLEDEKSTFDVLCGKRFGKIVRSIQHRIRSEACIGLEEGRSTLLEQAVYTTGTDFPILGARLLALDEFSKRNSPSKIMDFWRDRRNPIQWYTFWVVTIIGGISLPLSLGQLLLAVAQVVFAA